MLPHVGLWYNLYFSNFTQIKSFHDNYCTVLTKIIQRYDKFTTLVVVLNCLVLQPPRSIHHNNLSSRDAPTCRIVIWLLFVRINHNSKAWWITRPHAQLGLVKLTWLSRSWRPAKNILDRIQGVCTGLCAKLRASARHCWPPSLQSILLGLL